MCCWSKAHPFEQGIGTSDFSLPNLTQQRRGRNCGTDISPHHLIWSSSYPHIHRSRICNGACKGTFYIGTLFICIFKSVANQQNRGWHSFIGQTDLRLEHAHCQSLLHELKDWNSLGLLLCRRFVGGRQVRKEKKRWLRLVLSLFAFIHYSGEGDALV